MIIGIDLGTTNSLVSCFKDGEVQIIKNRLNKTMTPSVVAINEKNEILVGDIAKEYGYLHPEDVVKTFKKEMGTDTIFKIKDFEFRAEELSSFILKSLKEDAQNYLQEEVEEAIISVPAYFNDKQRKATQKAGELAGLKVNRIMNEPTASALAYGVGEKDKMERCLVFDLGGGTFDVSILEYFSSIMEVHAIAGDNHLGGEDFTNVLMDMFLKRIHKTQDELDLYTKSRLYKEVESAKLCFSKDDVITIHTTIQSVYYSESFTLEQYEIECAPLLERLKKPIEKSIHDAQIVLNDIDRVLMVGGASRLPIIRQFVKKYLHVYPEYYVNPDTSVVQGAALQCGMKMRSKEVQEMILCDVCPFTLGTEVIQENNGFEEAGQFLPIIERNTIIPVSKKETVYTANDNQDWVTVKVLQGESRMAKKNLLLAQLDIQVPKGPKGQEAIEITYTYDINSVLEVEVEVVSTKEKKRMIIQDKKNPIPDEEIQKRLDLLSYLKQNPREEEENYFVLVKGNRLYEQNVKNRDQIENVLIEFETLLDYGTRLEIERARKKALELFEEIENEENISMLS